jgi:hypothetical protein
MMPRIRPVAGSDNLMVMRRGLRVRYGWKHSGVTLWGAYRWTRLKAMAELIDAMEALGL